MRNFGLIAVCIIFLLSLHSGSPLRCRVSNPQTDDQFQKILHVCKKRNSGRDADDSDGSFDDSDNSDNSKSAEDIFDKRLFLKSNNRYASTSAYGDQNHDDTGRNNKYMNRNDRSHQSNHTYGSSRNTQNRNSGDYRWSMNQRSQGRMGNSGLYDNDNYNNGREKACVIQCFFNELNVVDQRGFPERRAVTDLLTENIQDPELRDFIEESITECFHFLNSGPRKEKCDFSQNILSCLAEKGKERCEDWD